LTPARLSATVAWLRREPEGGVSVLMMQRHAKSRFMPNAWVFPGGAMEPEDGQGWEGALWCALRETAEEMGVWPVQGDAPPPGWPATLGEAPAFYALLGEDARPPELVPWCRWVTPAATKRRFDARFFVAWAPAWTDLVPDDREVARAAWWRPRAAIDDPQVMLAPPTLVVLQSLAGLDLSRPLQEQAMDLDPVQPIRRRFAEGPGVVLPGHGSHPLPARPGVPTALAFRAEGWVEPAAGPLEEAASQGAPGSDRVDHTLRPMNDDGSS